MVWVRGSGKWPNVFISELFECYFSGPWIHGISRCDHSSVVHSTSILLSHYQGLNVEKFLLFFLLSVLTLYNDQVQSFPSILNTSFLFTFVFQAHDQAVTGLSLHATGNLILSTVLTLMLILSLILYFYKSACTRSSIGTPARSPNWPIFSFQIVFCLLMKQKKNFLWNYLISTGYLGDHFLHSYMARMFIKLVAV